MKFHDLDFESSVDLNDDIIATLLGGKAKLQQSEEVRICENCIIQEPVTFIQPNPVQLPQKKRKVRKNS